jgi:hypothetical protein
MKSVSVHLQREGAAGSPVELTRLLPAYPVIAVMKRGIRRPRRCNLDPARKHKHPKILVASFCSCHIGFQGGDSREMRSKIPTKPRPPRHSIIDGVSSGPV